ncbi:unnamed protein product [Rhizophagus irregularis]|nr:unnamed protein product [Rhizophagus irregularis]
MKNLFAKLDNKWTSFINDLYKYLREIDISKFFSQWDVIKTSYPCINLFITNRKTKKKWAACFNCNIFIVNMITTTQREKSMNNIMKGYLDATFTSEVENLNKVQSKVQSNTLNIIPTVKNPLVIRKKGYPSNKRIKSAGELTDKSNNKKKKKADENANNNMSKNLSFDNFSHFNESDFLSNKLNLKNDQDKNIKYFYCGETLPNLLPSKVSEYLNDILMEKKLTHRIVEQYEFCLVYKELKSDLLKIIKSQRYSKFCIDAVKRIQEIGKSKVDHPLYQINYFESFQPEYYGPKGLEVISKNLIEMFI